MSLRKMKSAAAAKLRAHWSNCAFLTLIFASVLLFFLLIQYLLYRLSTLRAFNGMYDFSSKPDNAVGWTLLTLTLLLAAGFLMLELNIYRRAFYVMAFGRAGVEGSTICHDMQKLTANAVGASLLSFLIKLLSVIPAAAAGALLYYSVYINLYERITTPRLLLFSISIALLLVFTLVLCFVHMSLVLVPYILIDAPATRPAEAIRASWSIMSGRKYGFFLFQLSFLKFLPLCVMIYPLFVLMPYYMMCCVFYLNSVLRAERRANPDSPENALPAAP
ncbi:MAG: DUF975 family protein [Oscillospiraceae bacterium]